VRVGGRGVWAGGTSPETLRVGRWVVKTHFDKTIVNYEDGIYWIYNGAKPQPLIYN